jgi:hypothetical protein
MPRPERRLAVNAIRLMRDLVRGAYAEDPCGAEDGFSGCEVMAEFRRAHRPAHRHQHARSPPTGVSCPRAVPVRDIPPRPALLDHGWSVRVAQTCRDWGSTCLHSNNHFDDVGHVHDVARLPPAVSAAIDTHWICTASARPRSRFRRGRSHVQVPKKPGLGVDAGHGRSRTISFLLCSARPGARRRCGHASKLWIPNWTFQPQTVCMDR